MRSVFQNKYRGNFQSTHGVLQGKPPTLLTAFGQCKPPTPCRRLWGGLARAGAPRNSSRNSQGHPPPRSQLSSKALQQAHWQQLEQKAREGCPGPPAPSPGLPHAPQPHAGHHFESFLQVSLEEHPSFSPYFTNVVSKAQVSMQNT